MDDSVSMVIGLTVVWQLVMGSQGEHTAFNPVTAFWIIAIPLIDMTAIMYRRLNKGQSPFTLGRNHPHLIFMRSGRTSNQKLQLITSITIVFTLIGITIDVNDVLEVIKLVTFNMVFSHYVWLIQHIWRVIPWFHKVR